MAVIAHVVVPGVTTEQYDRVRALCGWLERAPDGGLAPSGLEARPGRAPGAMNTQCSPAGAQVDSQAAPPGAGCVTVRVAAPDASTGHGDLRGEG